LSTQWEKAFFDPMMQRQVVAVHRYSYGEIASVDIA
jgi:hypothetical protein